MKKSGIAQRMQQNHRRFLRPARLNLVSLMDIFTILVFFLLVNSGDSEILHVNRQVKLPESVADQRPESMTTVTVTESGITVDGRPVATMDDVVNGSGLIAGLAQELETLAANRARLSAGEKARGRAVTIVGDHTIPYEILKRVMATCARSNYRDLSMAVTRVAKAGG
jgi:biopolymer transport protein ExbD